MIGASGGRRSVPVVKCSHCQTAFNLENADSSGVRLGQDAEFFWLLSWVQCPTCERFVIILISEPPKDEGSSTQDDGIAPEPDYERSRTLMVHPLGATRPLSRDVPAAYADRFQRAVRVLPLAADASAALSRRLLQDLIRDKAGITKRTLNDEIEALLESNVLRSELADDVDVIRQVGNFAAHPIKSQSTGEVVDVEPGEADWLLDVLEELLDFYFVRPAASQRRREKLNEKLKDTGKPELKAVQS